MGASASINSNVRDMSNWLLMQLDSGRFNGKRVVPFKVLAETRKSNTIVGDPSSRLYKSKHFSTYGLGWSSYDYEGRRIWEHSGGANGFVTKTEFIPEENMGVLVYTNTDANSLYEALAKQVIEAYLAVPYRNISEIYFNGSKAGRIEEQKLIDSLEIQASKKTKTELALTSYCGVYKNDFYGTIEIKNTKGGLKMYMSNHPNNIGTLRYLGNNEFLCNYSDLTCGVQVFPVKIENGEVKSMTVRVNDFIDYLTYDFEKQK
jgi:hypothetical protein